MYPLFSARVCVYVRVCVCVGGETGQTAEIWRRGEETFIMKGFYFLFMSKATRSQKHPSDSQLCGIRFKPVIDSFSERLKASWELKWK